MEARGELLGRRLGVEGDERVLERIRPEGGDDVRGHQHELVADVDIAAPDIGLDLVRWEAPVPVRVGQRRQSCASAEVCLGRAHRAHVQLVVADDGDAHADRARGVAQRAALAGVGQALVRDLDRLDEAHPDPGRFVVVVLAPDRVGDEGCGVSGARPGDARGDEEEEVALRPRLRTDARLHVERGVRRIGRLLRVGDDAELHLDPVGHGGPRCQLAGVGAGIIACR